MAVLDSVGARFAHGERETGGTARMDDLLRWLSEGDGRAWEEIIRRYRGVVFTTVRSYRLQDADVLDAVQMTWLRLAENAHRVRDPQRLAGWLITTARREALRVLRQQARHTLVPADELAGDLVDDAEGPEQRVIDSETRRTLTNLIADLPPLRRGLLSALFSDSPPGYGEVARSLGIPLGGVGPTRARALHQLRCRLHELGLGSRGAL